MGAPGDWPLITALGVAVAAVSAATAYLTYRFNQRRERETQIRSARQAMFFKYVDVHADYDSFKHALQVHYNIDAETFVNSRGIKIEELQYLVRIAFLLKNWVKLEKEGCFVEGSFADFYSAAVMRPRAGSDRGVLDIVQRFIGSELVHDEIERLGTSYLASEEGISVPLRTRPKCRARSTPASARNNLPSFPGGR